MIRAVTVDNTFGLVRRFEIGQVVDGIMLREPSGLGPVSADLGFAELVTNGAVLTGTYIGKRNIVLDFAMYQTPNVSLEASQANFYNLLSPGQKVLLEIQSDLRLGQVAGTVEAVVPNIFTKEPSLQVSIITETPWFLDGSVEPGDVMLPNTDAAIDIPYSGSVSTGFIMQIVILDNTRPSGGGGVGTGMFAIQEQVYGVGQTQTLGFWIHSAYLRRSGLGARWRIGDVITIDTREGRRQATLYRPTTGITYYITDAFKALGGTSLSYMRSTDWPRLLPLANTHRVSKYRPGTSDPDYNSYFPPSHFTVNLKWETYFKGF